MPIIEDRQDYSETDREPLPLLAALGYFVAIALCLLCGLIIGYHLGAQDNPPARIGNDRVPALHCQEDEAIVLNGTPTPICVNVEELGRVAPGQIVVQGEVYDVNAPDRPGCFAEPSEAPEGVEIILYAHVSDRTTTTGLEVDCPG